MHFINRIDLENYNQFISNATSIEYIGILFMLVCHIIKSYLF